MQSVINRKSRQADPCMIWILQLTDKDIKITINNILKVEEKTSRE